MKICKIFVMMIFGLGCLSAFADDMPAKSLPMTEIIHNLESKGYTAKEIKFDDNMYKIDAVDKQGKEVDVEINPETGALNQTTKNNTTLTLQAAAKKVESAGYHSIYYIKADDSKYVVKALDKDGNKVSLDVDGTSGAISKNLF